MQSRKWEASKAKQKISKKNTRKKKESTVVAPVGMERIPVAVVAANNPVAVEEHQRVVKPVIHDSKMKLAIKLSELLSEMELNALVRTHTVYSKRIHIVECKAI